MEHSILSPLLLQVVLISLNAIFACAEIAVITIKDNRLLQLAEQGDKRAKHLVTLTAQPANFLAVIQVAITLSGFLGSAFAADSFSDPLVEWLVSLGVPIRTTTLDSIAVVLITLILSYVTLVFGELVPKRIAMQNAERLGLGLSGIVWFIARLFKPVVFFLTLSTNAVLRLLHIDPNAENETVSEEEIRMMVTQGTQKGSIDATESTMIQNIFEFDDLCVSEFATHRTDVVVLWMDESTEDWARTIRETRHSRYPVCEETVDNVVGVLVLKEYIRVEDKSKENLLKEAVKPAYFVPEGVKADVLFRQLKASRNHFAVVLDEYGGMFGIITMNDLLEQIVGEFGDTEEVSNEAEIQRVDADTWRILGIASLDEVATQLGVELPTEEYDTFGGMVFGFYGTVPSDGTTFEIDILNLHVKVLEIRDHRIERTLVCVERAQEKSEDDED